MISHDNAPDSNQSLFIKEKLVESNKHLKVKRSPFHWFIFVLCAIIGFAPVAVGLFVGVSAVVDAIRFPENIPWWAAVLGILFIVYCVAGIILLLYGITEGSTGNLIAALVFAFVAWPAVGLMTFFFSNVIPNDSPIHIADAMTVSSSMVR